LNSEEFIGLKFDKGIVTLKVFLLLRRNTNSKQFLRQNIHLLNEVFVIVAQVYFMAPFEDDKVIS